MESEESVIVGVNKFKVSEEHPIPVLRINPAVEQGQREKLADLRARRDTLQVAKMLTNLQAAARTETNLMPLVLDAVRALATVGEICDTLREAWGTHQEAPSV